MKKWLAIFLVATDLAFLGMHVQEYMIQPAHAAIAATPAPKPVRWEYKVIDLSISRDQDRLRDEVALINSLALKGWEPFLMSSIGEAWYNRVMLRRRLP